MLRLIKRAVLQSVHRTGVFELVAGSGWRRRRLLILCYHSLSRNDEHLWKPQLFMEPSVFAQRMQSLRRSGANVLPLQVGIRRLYEGGLPDRSVAITFDDGMSDFPELAYPVLREHGFPVTVYMTTYYSENPYPVFRLMCGYLLWKSRNATVSLHNLTGEDLTFELTRPEIRLGLVEKLFQHARRNRLSAEERNNLTWQLAAAVGVEYSIICERRILQLMRPSEVRELASVGVDFQLHTHRHRSPPDEELYRKEIRENRASLKAMTGQTPRHFCYPSGRVQPEFLPWLREEGVLSATTCAAGLASPASDPLLLPRLVDVSRLSNVEFEGWISGAGAWVPRRPTWRSGIGNSRNKKWLV